MLPRVNLIGRLTRGPEIKYLPSGTCVSSFGVASSEKQKDKEIVCFIDCVVFGGLAEKVVQPYLKKGSQIYVEGRLKLDQWTDQQGVKRSKHSITVEILQMMDSRQADGDTNNAPMKQNKPTVTYQDKDGNEYEMPNIDDSEIPFSGGIR